MFGWKLGFMSRAGLLGTGLLFWTLALYIWQEETNTSYSALACLHFGSTALPHASM